MLFIKDLSQALMLLIIKTNPVFNFSSLFLSIQNQSEKLELSQTGDEMRSQDQSSGTQGKKNQGTKLVFSPKLVQGGSSFSPGSQFSFPLP